MSRTRVPIGVASVRSGVKVPTIRYYENIGLLPAPPRTRGNRRNYDAADLRRLVFIRHARELGFEIDAIRALLSIQDNPDQSCEGIDAIARARLGEVERNLRFAQIVEHARADQRHDEADDGDHHQHFHEGETTLVICPRAPAPCPANLSS